MPIFSISAAINACISVGIPKSNVFLCTLTCIGHVLGLVCHRKNENVLHYCLVYISHALKWVYCWYSTSKSIFCMIVLHHLEVFGLNYIFDLRFYMSLLTGSFGHCSIIEIIYHDKRSLVASPFCMCIILALENVGN